MNVPSISIVTPSYNQASYLEATIRSVLDQGYPKLEYVVLDGGSTDGSAAIVERYADQLSDYTIARDNGQYDAINRGLARTSGDVMGWLNSDDLYVPWTLRTVGEIFARFPQVVWITSAYPANWNKQGVMVRCQPQLGATARQFRRGAFLPGISGYARGWIQQETTFWRRSLWEQAGGLDLRYRLAADFALWDRFFDHAELYTVGAVLGGFRQHGEQKTSQDLARYVAEAREVLARHPPQPYTYAEARARIWAQRLISSGRIARLPVAARAALLRSGAVDAARGIVWRNNAWHIHTTYLI